MQKHCNQNMMKGITTVLLLSSFCLSRFASAQTHPPLYVPPNPAAMYAHQEQLRRYQETQERPQVTVKSNGIAIRVPNLTRQPDIPLLTLATMTRRYPHAQQFRLTWNCYAGLCISHSSALYNRAHHTVLLSVTGNIGKTEHSVWNRSLFTHVTDRAIAEDANRHRGVVIVPPNFFDDAPLAFFNDLTLYGCHVQTFPEPPPI